MTKEQLPGGGTVFGIGRRKTQGQLAKVELNQGLGHLRQAATYAAKGAGATVGPRVQAARGAVAPTAVLVRDRASSGLASTVAALAPLALAVRKAQAEAAGKAVTGRKAVAAKQAAATRKVKAKNMKASRKKNSRRGGSMMTGLLAAGAVAGVAAMAMRRRREQQEWTEYDPTRGKLEPMRDEVDSIEIRTPVTDASTMPSGSAVAGGPTGAGSSGAAGSSAVAGSSTGARSSAVAGGPTGAGSSTVAGGGSASTPGKQPTVHATDKVPSMAEGAKDTSGRPAVDLTEALTKGTTRTNGRR
ncbi:hypothetical protein [Micromonospora peucetia]|uniref:Uncharacterized protein n=1 Tax=Micromonospora peucetia TaxID=47871 RepID=A0ABZ1ELF1_9ACTN|nr:hypothetical protein [Micromonospora peucetia]WSA35074.1 hypothetical protein OIE14_14015 [Micromonospora peucetia]